jgi:DNA recombination-dependent growth factor C
MPVNMSIGTIETAISARDEEKMMSDGVIDMIVARVKEELEADENVKKGRARDRSASSPIGGER